MNTLDGISVDEMTLSEFASQVHGFSYPTAYIASCTLDQIRTLTRTLLQRIVVINDIKALRLIHVRSKYLNIILNPELQLPAAICYIDGQGHVTPFVNFYKPYDYGQTRKLLL